MSNFITFDLVKRSFHNDGNQIVVIGGLIGCCNVKALDSLCRIMTKELERGREFDRILVKITNYLNHWTFEYWPNDGSINQFLFMKNAYEKRLKGTQEYVDEMPKILAKIQELS